MALLQLIFLEILISKLQCAFISHTGDLPELVEIESPDERLEVAVLEVLRQDLGLKGDYIQDPEGAHVRGPTDGPVVAFGLQ